MRRTMRSRRPWSTALSTYTAGVGHTHTIFTESTAAMRQIVKDAPGPGQEMAIELARRIIDQGHGGERLRQKVLQTTHGWITTRYTPSVEEGPKGCCG